MSELRDIQAEASVLGALLIADDAWDDVAEIVSASDFANERHRRIFRAIARLAEDGTPRDTVTVSEQMGDCGDDLAYLIELVRGTPSAANVAAYAQIVRDRATLRALAALGPRVRSEIDAGKSAGDVLAVAERAISSLSEQSAGNPDDSMFNVAKRWYQRFVELSESTSDVTGIPTGFDDIDRRTAGLQRGDMIVIAGRPAMGKTVLSTCIARNVAEAGYRVRMQALEMTEHQLMDRLIADMGHAPLENVRKPRRAARDDLTMARISAAIKRINDLPMVLDTESNLHVRDVASRIRRQHRRDGLDLVVVDYVQLLTGDSEQPEEQISQASRTLKALAKELGIAVIAVCQLNRKCEDRPNKRPILADLRQSGQIEQDADAVAMVYRHEVYNPSDQHEKGIAEVIWRKVRQGEIGTDRLASQLGYSRFASLADGWQEDVA